MSEGEDPGLADTAIPFAKTVRASVAAGELSGAVATVATRRLLRSEAFGVRDQASQEPMELDTIFRMASASKAVFTAAALRLLEDGRFHLDDPVSKWAPELSGRRVLRTPTSELDDTVQARREISMFDVLSFQLGIGIYLAPQSSPLLHAMLELGVAPVTEPVPFSPDEFLARLGTLPLAHHPGETFMYHSGEDVLRAVISRIADQPFGELLRERVFEPLSMVDSGLSVPQAKRHRFSTCYFPRTEPGRPLEVWDEVDGRFAADPIFPNSIVSTVGDYLNFARMLLDQGLFQGRRFLSAESVSLMTTDHLSEAQKRLSPAPEGFWQTRGWGMGATVYSRSLPQGPNAGSYSWFGGYGPHFLVDPKRGSAVLLMTPRVVRSQNDTALGYGFELDTYRDILSRGTA
jgi:CubicO group peptidase (beta-lactamase class C family)